MLKKIYFIPVRSEETLIEVQSAMSSHFWLIESVNNKIVIYHKERNGAYQFFSPAGSLKDALPLIFNYDKISLFHTFQKPYQKANCV